MATAKKSTAAKKAPAKKAAPRKRAAAKPRRNPELDYLEDLERHGSLTNASDQNRLEELRGK